jgi:hypothetical protein
MLPTLANAGDLAQWANRLDAPGYLPKLIRSLILATAGDITRLDMRSGEGIRYPGYDGIVEAGRNCPFVPIGLSVWEMGVNQDPKGKAEDDYTKRTKDPLDVDPSQATFVFITPRRWSGKEDWVEDKRVSRIWHDVWVHDADDLETWIELAPAVHVWISRLLGKDPGDTRALDTFWMDWREATEPPLSTELIVTGREEAAQRIATQLQGPPGVLTVRADAQHEALAFIAAALEQQPEDVRDEIFARALVVDSVQTWRQITLAEQPMVLLPTFTPVDVVQATRQGHHILIPAGREIAESSGMVTLQRPSRQAAEEALQAMGLGQGRASSLASLASQSLLSLRRKLSRYPEVQQPAWASPGKARSVLPALLAASWDEALEGDQDVVAALAGHPYEEVAQDLVRYAHESDPPVRQIGSVWFLVSREDAWRLLARYLTKQDMKRFRDVILDVFGTLDPALELSVDERWMANAVGKSRPHSMHLREGLADNLALMATRADDTFLGGTSTGQDHATGIVAHLLRQANGDPSGQLWMSLTDVLPSLAEAAPDDFLNAVDTASAGADPLIHKLFTDTTQVTFTAHSAHTSLLWSLERLAWSPDYLSGATLALARLARLDPGGRLANRPGNSLRGIFVLWYPQTAASFEERLHVLDMLREREPTISWKLMISLLPKPHETADSTAAPRLREWKPEEREASFTYTELWHATEALITRLLADVGVDSDRICDVVERIENLPPLVRTTVLEYLESLDPAALDTSSREAVCAILREQIARHRRFSQAQWAMPIEDIARLRAIYERFKSEDMIQQVSPLFTASPHLLDEPEEPDMKKHEDAVYQAQVAAAQQVYQAEGLTGLFTLIEATDQPGVPGWVLGKSGLVEVEEDHLLQELGSSDTKRRLSATEYVAGRFSTCGWEWADKKLDANGPLLTPHQRADFFLRLPANAQTWDRLERFDDGTADLYWSQFIPWVENATDCLRAVDQLLAHGQTWQTLGLLVFYLDTVKPEANLIMNVLEAALNTPLGTSMNQSLHYNISQLLTYLEQAEDADEVRLGRIEWALLPLFRYENRSLKILYGLIAADPEFFVDIVATVYRATDEAPRELDEQGRTRAEAAYHLLRSASIVSGTQDDGTIDPAKLSEWVGETRRRLEERKRLEVGDQCIGHILHHAKQEDDELWPPQVIRDLLEKLRSDDIELGLEIAERNARGVTWRNPTAGGEQERQIMNRYLAQARRVQLKWPRTTRMLRRIAQAYASEARMNDRDAELREDRW